jgi:hypothetical protein
VGHGGSGVGGVVYSGVVMALGVGLGSVAWLVGGLVVVPSWRWRLWLQWSWWSC